MSERINPSCPPQILEWIAWYPDGGLSDAQRGAVEVHATHCASCREDLAVLAGRADTDAAPADPDLLFERVLARIEAAAVATPSRVAASRPGPNEASPNEAGRTEVGPARRAPAGRRRIHDWQRHAAIVAAGFALIAVTGALGWLGRDWMSLVGRAGVEESYRTAAAREPTAPGGVALDVVFRSEASAEQIQTLLRGLGATITTGPTELGRYRLVLPPGSDARAAAALLRAEESGIASYAEPVRP